MKYTSIKGAFLLSIEQVAELEKCSVQNIYSLIKNNKSVYDWFQLKANVYHPYKVGKTTLLHPDESNRYIKKHDLVTIDKL